MTQTALAAGRLLAERDLDVSIWSVSCPLEVDRLALEEACSLNYILTVEDHHTESGMGSIMALEMARRGLVAHFANLGVTRYGDSGPAADVYAAMGLSAEGIADAFERLRS